MTDPDAEGRRLWAVVSATVRPLAGRSRPVAERLAVAETRRTDPPTPRRPTPPAGASFSRRAPLPPAPLEPGRLRRLTRGVEPIAGRIDLHGLTQDGARVALTAYLLRGHALGVRSVLVITGKGLLGDGVLRRRAPEWLGEPPLRDVVAGLSEAHRRHGGDGALYVALKRRATP